jgi:hypothetical protein
MPLEAVMMRRWTATSAAVLLVTAALRADVTVTQTTTVEGAAAQMMGGATPRVVMRIKGTKMRSESEAMGNSVVMISDLATKQTIMLNAADKTARIVSAASPELPTGTTLPNVDVSFKPTGQKRTIDDFPCDEYAISVAVDMGSVGRGNAQPPEAGAMMAGVKMVLSGSAWLARSGPGIAEFAEFNKRALDSNMMAGMAGMAGGANGFDKIMAAAAEAKGLPYLTEMNLSVEGAGPMVEMMKQMGQMKITTRVTAISTEVLSDELFKVPAGYTMVEK